MKKGILIAAVSLVALAAAPALWLALDDGSRNQAALAETTETEALDCDRAKDAEACAELNRLLADLDVQLAEIDRRQESVQAHQDAIKRNAHYLAGTNSELSELDMVKLQLYLERRAKFFETLSNLMKKIADTQQSILSNLK